VLDLPVRSLGDVAALAAGDDAVVGEVKPPTSRFRD